MKREIATVFISHLDEPLRAEAEAAGEGIRRRLVAEIEERFESAWTRFGSLEVDETTFARWLAERATDDDGTLELPNHSEDGYLACACAAGQRAALVLFDNDVLGQTRPVLRRLGCSDADAEEILQQVREKLLVAPAGGVAKLNQYRGSGPLLGWVRIVAGRQALAMRRARKPEETLEPDLLNLGDDPHLRNLKTRYRSEFRAAFRGAVAALDDHDRGLLTELVVHEKPVHEIASERGVHRVTASRWLAKIRRTLLEDTRARLAATLELASTDVDSVIRLIDSQLDISLFSVLAD